ncbi:MAG: DUF3810 domain-containing protein [Sedimentibacter sp.]|uniref:DUF3810 domain-containing protein n=1 Tax=Sedimentibacter sp. TaxID=1960295 RepID=UPI002980B8C6|nr:DUF3810 domain-containing protein [Sedimentibacter sp.]MDW5299037.1 DUF3810 domain-containing protein [Sedimentibacter sp.]
MKNRLMFLILIPISLILTIYAKLYMSFAEFYAVEIYPVFAGAISFFTSKSSFSLAEVIIVALIILLILYTLSMTINSFKYKTTDFFKNYIVNIGVAVSCMYCLFVLFCGLNYYRYEFTRYSGLEIKESSKEELINMCEVLINDANEMRAELHTSDENTAELYDHNYYGTAERAKNSFNNIASEYEILKGNYPAPKPVRLSKVMSYMNITGVFFPFTFEANVNVDIPPYQIPAIMLHELVHLRGFMREEEANFISYLACTNSGYDDFAYSGTMLALSYSMNVLYYEDYDAFEKLYETYSEDDRNNLKFSKNYWKQFDTKVAEISKNINDTYLKANNQEDGIKSYGRMVDLLLAYYRESV